MGKGASNVDRDPHKCQALLDLIPKSSARRSLVVSESSLLPGSQELHPLLKMHPNLVSEVLWHSSDFLSGFASPVFISCNTLFMKRVVWLMEKWILWGCTCSGKKGLTLWITDQQDGNLPLLETSVHGRSLILLVSFSLQGQDYEGNHWQSLA